MYLTDDSWLIRMFLDYPYLPTPPSVIDIMLNLIKLDEDDVFADLGSGEGDVLIRVAEKFNCFCTGFEINFRLLSEAKRKIKRTPLSGKMDVVCADLFAVDLSRFDAIYVYPFPTIAGRLSEIMRQECKKGAKVLTYDYQLPNFKTVKTVRVQSGMHAHRIYLYKT